MPERKYRTALGFNGFGWASVVADMPYHFTQILRHAKELGFDGVELFGLPDPYPTKTSELAALRRQVEDHGLAVASMQSLPGGLGNGHPGSAYSLCRNQYIGFIRESLEAAHILGCDSVGVWAGELLGDGPSKLSVDYMVETYAACATLASDAQIPLCLEAEPVPQVNTPEVWFKILRGASSPFLKALCDFAHLNILSSGQPLELIEELLPFVGHTHLSGNDGTCTDFESRSSTHLTLGEGPMDWQAMLSVLLDGGYTGWLDIDLWEHPDSFGGAESGKQALDKSLAQWCDR